MFFFVALTLGGSDDEIPVDEADAENAEDEEKKRSASKAMGLPEIDPDALPSSLAQKYLNLECTTYL